MTTTKPKRIKPKRRRDKSPSDDYRLSGTEDADRYTRAHKPGEPVSISPDEMYANYRKPSNPSSSIQLHFGRLYLNKLGLDWRDLVVLRHDPSRRALGIRKARQEELGDPRCAMLHNINESLRRPSPVAPLCTTVASSTFALGMDAAEFMVFEAMVARRERRRLWPFNNTVWFPYFVQRKPVIEIAESGARL